MKKFFSLFAAVLFAGSMMAAEKTVTYVFQTAKWAAKVDGTDANWVSGKDGAGFTNNGVQVTTSASGANATSPEAFTNVSKVVVTYNTNKSGGAGTFEVKIGENAAVSKGWAYSSGDGRSANYTTQFDFDTKQSGTVTLTTKTTTNSAYVVSVAITYNEDESAPAISAKKINLGLVVFSSEAENYEKDTTLEVKGANLTSPISVTNGVYTTATETALPAAGGTLNLHIAAPAGEMKDTIVLKSGDLTVKVPVEANIKQAVVLPGTPIKVVAGTSAMDATVNGIAAIKAGSGSAAGSAKVTVPATAVKLHFFAAAWTGEGGELSIAAEGVTANPAAVNLTADDGISGSGSDYELKTLAAADCAYHIALSGLTGETTITLSRSAAKERFVIWGATYETAGSATAIDNTELEGKAIKAIENGQLVIIKNGVRYNALGNVIR